MDKKYWSKKSFYFRLPEGKRVIADDGLAGKLTKITVASKLPPKELQDYQTSKRGTGNIAHKVQTLQYFGSQILSWTEHTRKAEFA